METGRDNDSLAVSLTECQEALSEWRFGKQTCDTYFVGADVRTQSFGIDSKHLGDISFENEDLTTVSSAQMGEFMGDSYVY